MLALNHSKLPILNDPSVRASLAQIRVGLEKESLRVTEENLISLHDHPEALGKTLTHKYITTDFAEAQLEFITPANTNMAQSIQFLKDIHIFSSRRLPSGEFFWNASMPPNMSCDEEVRIAQYGKSNAARIKTLYRQGLANRYGKVMQTISGIHYNFSLPEDIWEAIAPQGSTAREMQHVRSDGYLSLIRNVQRHGWLVLYLFGATPALDKSYLKNKSTGLKSLGDDTLYAPYATSLRMSDLGYTSVVQGKLDIHFNSMADYLDGLRAALGTSEGIYEEIGVHEDGDYKQMNTHQLQLENELYGTVRPKRNALSNERPITALCRGGVEYIELRSVDINPFLPVGIDEQEAYFLNTFLTYLALAESEGLSPEEQRQLNDQLQLVAVEGRKPDLLLPADREGRTLKDAGLALLVQMRDLAKLMDEAHDSGRSHQDALEVQIAKLENPELTPSAKVLAGVKRYGSHQAFISALAKAQTDYFKVLPQDSARKSHLEAHVAQSRAAHEQIESAATESFENYLSHQAKYFCPPDCFRK
ncbi:glutamate--cysteine ligase [Flexibacterium corallicola]|uniref:glutamate--cysteine ligase n=1 Tax=Flexibacterium corallicola TaxID=3037259 RepID=UPI00286EECCE|nr:glutamate--cysteine ligase [Pseudovibrio sp. M1P-2-3]